MDADVLASRLPDWLREGWGARPSAIGPVPAGMNSATALVELTDGHYVAKWVRADAADALDRGSTIAARLAGHGLATGPARPTLDGALSLRTPDGAVALLDHLDGTPLTGTSEDDQCAMADVLARVHVCEYSVRCDPFLRDWWAEPAAEPGWLIPVLRRILERYDALPPIGWGVVHADPNAEAFVRTTGGEVGVIDWGGARTGPLLYDVASALMYLGGRDGGGAFLDRYRQVGPLPDAELDTHLELFGLIRAGVQAAYFAGRLAADDLTGIDDRADNVEGMTDAQRMLADHGIETPSFGDVR